jgi:cytochrome P450
MKDSSLRIESHGGISTSPVELAGRMLLEPDTYLDDDTVRLVCSRLREADPVHRVEHPDYPAVWALTRRDDIREVETQSRVFLQGRTQLLSREEERLESVSVYGRPLSLIHMDGEEHRIYRGLTSSWFTPRNLGALSKRVDELAARAVERMIELGDSCDFVEDIATDYPLQVIFSLLGLPEEDYSLLLRVSKALSGAQDMQMSAGMDRESALDAFYEYFSDLTDKRRASPTEDLASVIANSRLPGDVSMELGRTIWYYIIFAVAGHDTTTRSLAGGLRAFIERPYELARLRQDRGLLDTAVNEVLRWVTPVKHFTRIACASYRLGDKEIRPNDVIFLSYPAGNTDPEAFPQPDRFDIGRPRVDHLAFGAGPHYCLGSNVARIELRALFAHLLPRLQAAEFNGEPCMIRSNLIGGLQKLPLRYVIE